MTNEGKRGKQTKSNQKQEEKGCDESTQHQDTHRQAKNQHRSGEPVQESTLTEAKKRTAYQKELVSRIRQFGYGDALASASRLRIHLQLRGRLV